MNASRKNTRSFGKSWSGVFTKQTATPIGQKCGWCEEEIIDGDQGVITSGIPLHKNCFFRCTCGPVGCHNNKKRREIDYEKDRELPDPPGMTLREAADAAMKEYEEGYK